MFTVHVVLPDPGGVEAAVVNEGAVFDEVRQDGTHRCAVVARGLNSMKRIRYVLSTVDLKLAKICESQ